MCTVCMFMCMFFLLLYNKYRICYNDIQMMRKYIVPKENKNLDIHVCNLKFKFFRQTGTIFG